MGRWINIVENNVSSAPTKLTQTNSVSFVSSNIKRIEHFVADACSGLDVSPQFVIDSLLCEWDEGNVLDGSVSIQQLKAYIETWLSMGASKYSGK